MPGTCVGALSPHSGRRYVALVVTTLVTAVATILFGPISSASGSPSYLSPEDLCSTETWRNPANFDICVKKLKQVAADRASCVKPPTPGAPDSGMAGWFATRPEAYNQPGHKGQYTSYGYAGYDYTTYDIGCAPTVMHPDYKFENTIANGEFLVATSIIGASNALRERAWDPSAMWQWADPLVDKATKAVYQKVFTVFGAITLAVVGLYLLWRAQQSDMSTAITTAAWAIFVMVAVTAIAAWPTWSANVADKSLITSLGVVHDAIGPPSQDIPADQCRNRDPEACVDKRGPALRASDTAVEGMLYRNWLRGLLGSSESETAKKYGPVLYDAKSFTWREIQDIRKNPADRQAVIDNKADHWKRVAEQIKAEDPEAYEYLTGTRGMERIGAGIIAILSAIFFGLFDIVASVLVLLGFLIFRWAVVAAPILGTFGLLQPASSGLRRLANVVIAAIFNIIIFGTGAAIYLYAVNLIMGTAALPGWLQVVLILLTGVVGWILLRPYKRIAQLGGGATREAGSESWGRLLLRDLRASSGKESEATEQARPKTATGSSTRPESRHEDVVVVGAATDQANAASSDHPDSTSAPSRRHEQWEEPDIPREAPVYAIYQPNSEKTQTTAVSSRRPESVSLPG